MSEDHYKKMLEDLDAESLGSDRSSKLLWQLVKDVFILS